jgi:hypothetical protein
LRRLLTTAVGIGIEGKVHRARPALTLVVSTQLAELQRIRVIAQSASNVVESGLPQHSQIEHPLCQDDLRIFPNAVPCV